MACILLIAGYLYSARNTMKRCTTLIGCWLIACPLLTQAYPIAGLAPDRRPEGAPVMSAPAETTPTEARMVQGIPQPVPESISRWIKDQGGWFTPFSHPGMPGRYDLRGWHDGKH